MILVCRGNQPPGTTQPDSSPNKFPFSAAMAELGEKGSGYERDNQPSDAR